VPREPIPPRTELEKSIAMIWAELLNVENPGMSDDFFEVGGQSLIATRLLSRIRALFERPITMREFFDDPTIGGLARRISNGAPEMINAAGAE
jgi:hypothetical protein